LRQSGWLLLFGVVWVISGWIIFVFHALLPSVLRNWLRRTDRNGNRRFVPIAT
jgi:threonine/homoserine/homoserine lactone efflux protein